MIHNMERFRQFIDYEGIGHGKCRLSDLDGWMELQDKAFVFVEVKLDSTPLPHGQRIALERTANALSETGRYAVVIVAEHHIKDTSQDVILADCNVREYYWNGEWRIPSEPITVKDKIGKFIAWAKQSNPSPKPILIQKFLMQVFRVNEGIKKGKQ